MGKDSEKSLAAAVLANSGEFSKTSIMHLLGFNQSSLGKALEEAENSGYLAEYRKKEADALDILKSKTLETLSTRNLVDVPAEKLVTMFKGLNEASRLARGQSTSNMAVIMNAINQVANSRLNRNIQAAQSEDPRPEDPQPDPNPGNLSDPTEIVNEIDIEYSEL